MKWPVLGIVLIFFVQLGFVLATYLGSGSDTFAELDRATRVESLTTTGPFLYGNNDLSVLNAAVRTDIKNKTAGGTDALKPRPTANRTYNTRGQSRPASYVAVRSVAKNLKQPTRERKPLFVNTTITYPDIRVTDKRGFSSATEDPRIADNTLKGKQKRSFFSRSVSVLKKPYDWIKAIGSKLN